MKTWRVSYGMTEPVAVATPVSTYPAFGVTLQYDTSGKLVGLEHELETEDSVAEHEATVASSSALRLIWESLGFLRGIPLPVTSPRIELRAPSGTLPALRIRATATVRASAVLVHTIAMPSEQSLLAAAGGRLPVWLHLASLANDAEATSDANAIRNYYMILEDLRCGSKNVVAAAEERMKFARDFVSHGVALNNAKALAFLHAEFGKPVTRYDPPDGDHLRMVRKWRGEARSMTDAELKALLW
jgi:hypothetical protein